MRTCFLTQPHEILILEMIPWDPDLKSQIPQFRQASVSLSLLLQNLILPSITFTWPHSTKYHFHFHLKQINIGEHHFHLKDASHFDLNLKIRWRRITVSYSGQVSRLKRTDWKGYDRNIITYNISMIEREEHLKRTDWKG